MQDEVINSAAPAAEQQQEAPAAIARRVIAGLIAGRIVNFKLNDIEVEDEPVVGGVRALFVVNPQDGTGDVSGILFFDPERDRAFLPEGVPASSDGMAFLPAVPYDETGQAGTWCWPQRQPVVASAVDAAAFDTQLESVRQEITQLVNAKLGTALESVKDLLEAQSAANKQLLIDAGLVKGEEAPPASTPPANSAGVGG